MESQAPVPIGIVCDNALAREGMCRILEGDDFVVEAHRSIRALLDVKQRISAPKIVILDLDDEGSIGLTIEEAYRGMPDARMVVLSNDFDFESMLTAFRSGADGYFVKSIGCKPLIESLKLVHLGEKVMPSELADRLPNRWAGGGLPTMCEREVASLLSEREMETLRFLILGSPNKVIAGHLNISEATVKVHVKAILRKLGAQNRTQAAIWAVNNGIELKATELIAANNCDDQQEEIFEQAVASY